jgi:NTP pyrophosphatase (non-canonical NTP hydrolase)
MTEQDYLSEVLRTYAGPDTSQSKACLAALGLAGESGEVVDLTKKYLFQGHEMNPTILCDELGDVLWYFILICHTFGLTIEEVMQRNVDKLRRRYPNGFEADRSIHR